MRLSIVLSFLLSTSSYVLAEHKHHHGDLQMDEYHRRIQKRNSTPFEMPMPMLGDDTSASTSTASSGSPYTTSDGTRPFYDHSTGTESTTYPSSTVAGISSAIGTGSITSAEPTTSGLSQPISTINSDAGLSPSPISPSPAASETDISSVPDTSATLIGSPTEPTSTAGVPIVSGTVPSTASSGLAPSPTLSPLPIINFPPRKTTTDSVGVIPSSGLSEASSGVSGQNSGTSLAKSASPTLRPAFPVEHTDALATSTTEVSEPGTSTLVRPSTSTERVATRTKALTNSTALVIPSNEISGTSSSQPASTMPALATTSPASAPGTGVSSVSTGMSTTSSTPGVDAPTMVLPPTLITAEPTPTSPVSNQNGASSNAQPTDTGAGTIVNALPAAIAPASGMIMPNSSQTMIQFGFYEALNYPFVVSNALATAQILSYAPKCAAFALGLPTGSILDNSLRPYSMGSYTATVAYLVIPSSSLEKLEALWSNSTSLLYNQQDSSLQSLVLLIDRSIPLLLTTSKSTTNKNNGGTSSSDANVPGSTANPASFGSLADTGTSSSNASSSVKKIAGIGLGSAAAAGAYASIMFYAARRYRSRRITLFAPSAASYISRPGSRYDRGISISRPMNPENSLGI